MTRDELAQIRAGHGKNQKDFAELLGVSMPSLRNWEQGVSRIPAYVPVIVRALAASPRWRAALVTSGAVEFLPDVFNSEDAATLAGSQAWPAPRYLPDHVGRTVYFFME